MKKHLCWILLLPVLCLGACGELGSSATTAKLSGTWVVDYDETVAATLALQGIKSTTPEQLEAVKDAIKAALGQDAFMAIDVSKKTISAKMMEERLDAVPFKVEKVKNHMVTISYDNREDTFLVRDDDRLQVTNGGGALVLRKK